MHSLTLSPSQRRELAGYLANRSDAMPLAQVEGYLFALICSPDPVEPQQWLTTVLGGQEAEDSVLFALMSLHHEISEEVFSSGFNLPEHLQFDFDDGIANFARHAGLHLWSAGFVLGAQGYVSKLLAVDALSDELRLPLQMAYNSLGYFSNLENAAGLAAEQGLSLGEFSLEQYQLMGDFALGFAELIEMIAMASGLYEDEGWE